MKIFLKGISALIILLALSACKSTPSPTGDRLVSVSWVNPTPVNLQLIETRICGSKSPVHLEVLPAYSEVAVDTDQPLFHQCRIQTRFVSGKEKISLLSVQLTPPLRKSPEREYNLRIQLRGGEIQSANLEPVRLTRERLGD